MRTAVIRVDIDPTGTLTPAAVRAGMGELLPAVERAAMSVVGSPADLERAARRELQFLAQGEDAAVLQESVDDLCRHAFGTEPANGVVTWISRGTDEDALGVLAGFGLTGQVDRVPAEGEWDVVTVRLPSAALDRIPESRIQTALEASLNCEVRIVAV